MSFAKPISEPKEKIFLGLTSIIAHVRGESVEKEGSSKLIGHDLHKQVLYINSLEKMLSKGGILKRARSPLLKQSGATINKQKKTIIIDKNTISGGSQTQR